MLYEVITQLGDLHLGLFDIGNQCPILLLAHVQLELMMQQVCATDTALEGLIVDRPALAKSIYLFTAQQHSGGSA